ncbi:hypothetical protein ACLD9W_07540 [Neisseria sp. WLZKY-1]
MMESVSWVSDGLWQDAAGGRLNRVFAVFRRPFGDSRPSEKVV